MVNKIAISITTNENPEVIQSVIKNFSTASSHLYFFLHVSKNSSFPLAEYFGLENQFSNLVVNRTSVFTVWGNIFQGHIENLRLIDADSSFTHFGFHATNDMFVRKIPIDFFAKYRVGYFNNLLSRRHTWFSTCQVNKDSNMKKLNEFFGFDFGVQSQVEGTFYPTDFLSEALRLTRKFDLKPHNRYPVEEIYFPTLARNLGLLPETQPYIFSEVQRYEQFRKLARKYKLDLGSNNLLNILARIYQAFGNFEISQVDVDEVIKSKIPPILSGAFLKSVSEGYSCSRSVFGVKRVPRELGNELRSYIESFFH